METYAITKLVTVALMAALIYGTLLFFMVKGFINPLFKWLYVFLPLAILLQLFTFSIYPLTIFSHPVFRLFQVFCFLGGISGAAKYYWHKKKNGQNSSS